MMSFEFFFLFGCAIGLLLMLGILLSYLVSAGIKEQRILTGSVVSIRRIGEAHPPRARITIRFPEGDVSVYQGSPIGWYTHPECYEVNTIEDRHLSRLYRKWRLEESGGLP